MTLKDKVPEQVRLQYNLIKKGIEIATRMAIFWKNTTIEKEHVRIRPNFDTACWNWRPHFHSIYIGADILNPDKNPLMKVDLSEEQRIAYVGVFYQHEKGHAFYTHKDLIAVKKLLNQLKTSFSVFNLLEDARIEHLIRTVNKLKFNWLNYENQKFTSSPSTWLFSMIQCEGDESLIAQYLNHLKTSLPEAEQVNLDSRFKRVKWYYDTVRTMTSYPQVARLSQSWTNEFGAEPENSRQQSGESSGESPGKFDSELQEMASLQGNPSAQSQLDEECDNHALEMETPQADTTSSESDAKGMGKEESISLTSDQAVQAAEFLDAHTPHVDGEAALACANLLAKVLTPRQSKVSSTEPSRKMNMKSYVKGRVEFIHKTTVARKGKKKLCLIVDCSGSMNGAHIAEAKVIILAMSILAQRGLLEGYVILSKVAGYQSKHTKLTLPVEENVIASIGATGGGEGLDSTLHAYLKDLKSADFSWVFTDGHITDTPVNKQFFYSIGLELIGIYTSEVDSCRSKLNKHFHKVIVRENALEVLKLLLLDM